MVMKVDWTQVGAGNVSFACTSDAIFQVLTTVKLVIKHPYGAN